MGFARSCRHASIGTALAVFVLSTAIGASGDDSDVPSAGAAAALQGSLVGEYRHSTVSAAGKVRRSIATIAPRGAGLSVAWEEDGGNLFGGIGVILDGVIGAAYTEALNGSFRGNGVLAYHIKGGTLDGVRLPYDSVNGQVIRETLEGSAALEGRYAIARSLAPDGHIYHSGYVEIVRHGDTYRMTWYTPARSYDGVGLRVGDVLVASYGSGFAPGIVAYCADKGLLTGIGTYGFVGTVGADSMKRVNDGGPEPSAETSIRCREAIDRWNPSLVRG